MHVRRAVHAGLLTIALFLGLILDAGPAAAGTPSAPTGVASTSQSTTALALRWSAVSGAASYQVSWSPYADLRASATKRASGTSIELTGLTADTAYFVAVRGVTSSGTLGATSVPVSFSTLPAGGYSYLRPVGLKATERSTNSLTLSWTSRGSTLRYRIRYATASSMSGAKSKDLAATSVRITGLTVATTYYVRVQVIDATGGQRSQESATLAVTTIPYPLSAVTGLTRQSAATTALALAWNSKPGVGRYRVRYSKSSAMSDPAYAEAPTGYAELTSLTPGTAYYVQVKALARNGDQLSSYPAPVRLTTSPAGGYPYLAPVGLKVTSFGSTSITLDWATRAADIAYQVAYTSVRGTGTADFSGSAGQLRKLASDALYSVRVRVVSVEGRPLSGLSAPVKLRTTTIGAAVIRAGSYNVHCWYCSDTAVANERPWSARRGPLVSGLLAQKLDVLALQEASQTRLPGTTISQFDDIVQRLGSPYKLANPYRYNCVNGYSNTKCIYQDRGASSGTKIIYNSRTLIKIGDGSRLLSSPPGKKRYAAWATFQHVESGRKFFFVSAHLEYRKDAADSSYFYDYRVSETRDIIQLIAEESGGLPVVIGGDFNSHKWTLPDNGPYRTLLQAGFADPLGNYDRSSAPTPLATVENRVRTNYNSYNGYRLTAPKSTNANGTYVDYLFTSEGLRVQEWETVVKLDSFGDFIGTIPSDHNLVRATVVLP